MRCVTPTRRDFLGASLAVAAGPHAVASTRPGAAGAVNLGLIGLGGRSAALIRAFLPLAEGRIVAVCDVHADRLARGRELAGGSSVRTYRDFRDMLASRDIDAVIIAAPDHWHALMTVMACRAGKDVYCEKPAATSVAEGRAAVQAARQYDRIVQIGTQQRSWDHYRKAVDIVRSGRLGEISEVQVWDHENHAPGLGSPPDGPPPTGLDWDLFLGPAPARPYNPNRFNRSDWFFDYGGGWTLDWGVHHHDIVRWAMDVTAPVSAAAIGGKFALPDDNREWPDTLTGGLEYGPGTVSSRGFLLQYSCRLGNGRDVEHPHAKVFCGTRASLLLDRTGYVLTAEAKRGKKRIADESSGGESEERAVRNHASHFLRSVHDHVRPGADIEVGHLSSTPGHLLNIAWRVGRKVRWDARNETISEDPGAAALLHRPYRSPWRLES